MQRYAFFRRKLACKILSMQKTYHAKKKENLAYMHQSNDLFIFLNSKYLILLNVNIKMAKKMTGKIKGLKKIPSVTSKLCQNMQSSKNPEHEKILRGQ